MTNEKKNNNNSKTTNNSYFSACMTAQSLPTIYTHDFVYSSSFVCFTTKRLLL